jgi:hypothetical protein
MGAFLRISRHRWFAAIFLIISPLNLPSFAQETTLIAENKPEIEHASVPAVIETPAPRATEQHRFFDVKNRILFAGVAASSAADFAITRANLQGGGKELNPVTRVFGNSTAGLAVNFAGETAGVIGISYMFHKTGHHKLERWVSMVNIGASCGAVGFDLANR